MSTAQQTAADLRTLVLRRVGEGKRVVLLAPDAALGFLEGMRQRGLCKASDEGPPRYRFAPARPASLCNPVTSSPTAAPSLACLRSTAAFRRRSQATGITTAS